ncbi:MAG: hemerythrin domain-containing protein [Nitrososphaeraceae archaeon]
MYATKDLKQDHVSVRRLKNIIERCSDKLYTDEDIPIEHIEIISVVIEEFVDRFHHGKEEQAYFPETKDKNGFAEDIRKFLIEHELGRRIAIMLRRELNAWKQNKHKKEVKETGDREEITLEDEDRKIKEPVARFLKSYAVFITDHTGKEDKFFDLIEEKGSVSTKEDQMLLEHYDVCRNRIGGTDRVEQMIRLIEYLEGRQWMKDE